MPRLRMTYKLCIMHRTTSVLGDMMAMRYNLQTANQEFNNDESMSSVRNVKHSQPFGKMWQMRAMSNTMHVFADSIGMLTGYESRRT